MPFALQAALNPPERGKRQKQWGDMTFRVGDRVMQTRNNYDVLWEKEDGSGGSGIFNGDVGVIQDIDPGGELITLGTDAHSPEHVGRFIRERQTLLKECGFTRFCTFEKQMPVWHAL